VPSYLSDQGLVFGPRGNGRMYGWDADNTAALRDRNAPNSPDQRYDTLAKMQEGADRFWEMAVQNGAYTVRVVAGDPSFTDSVYRINVENVPAVNGTPDDAHHWFDNTVTVNVTDGRLTISNASGAWNNKICFLEVRGAAPGALPLSLRAAPAPNPPAPVFRSGRLFSDDRIAWDLLV
jgi:hypothetical protein